jgi:hypothetical protein
MNHRDAAVIATAYPAGRQNGARDTATTHTIGRAHVRRPGVAFKNDARVELFWIAMRDDPGIHVPIDVGKRCQSGSNIGHA